MNLEDMAESLFAEVRSYIDSQVAKLVDAQVGSALALFKAAFTPPENGKDAPPVDLDALAVKVLAMVRVPKDGADAPPVDIVALKAAVLAEIPKPENGKDAPAVDVGAIVAQVKADVLPAMTEIARGAVAAIPAPKDGKDGASVDPTVLRGWIRDEIEDRVKQIPPAQNGKDANVVEVADAAAERVLARITMPKDGKSVELAEVVEQLKPLLAGEVADWELDFERRAADLIRREVDRFPKPRDGITPEGFEVEAKDGGRILLVKLMCGSEAIVREVRTDIPIDRGPYDRLQQYERGDGVTYGGSWYMALKSTFEAPGNADCWRLMVKRGRDA